MKKLIFAIATACVGAQFAHAEQVTNWFMGGANGVDATQTNGTWTKPQEGVVIADSKFTLELDHESMLDFTPTTGTAPDTNVLTRVQFVAKFEPQVGTLPSVDAKTALIVSNTAYYAYAWDGSKMDWVKLANANVAVSSVPVTVLSEIDYKTSSAPRVRYGIVDSTTTPWTTNFLNKAGVEPADAWLALDPGDEPYPTERLITKVSFCGDGELTSVRGDVQLGLFEVDEIKYGTSDEAVARALATDATIKVVRDNNETITIPSDAGKFVKIDANGHQTGAIDNQSDEPTEVALPAGAITAGSGEYDLGLVADPSKVSVTTTDKTKEVIVVQPIGGNLTAIVQTSAAIMSNVVFQGVMLAEPSNEVYRTFLRTYCDAQDGAYMKANTDKDAIISQLGGAGGNELPLWQSYVLGLNADSGTLATQPTGTDGDAGNLHISIPAVDPSVASGFDVTYAVMNGDSQVGKSVSNPKDIAIPVGTGTYTIKAVLTPKAK